MTAQFGHAVADLRVQQVDQPIDADLFQMRFAAPLAVELRKVVDSRMSPHRDSGGPGPGEQVRQNSRVAVHVMVGVDVSGRSADEITESRRLARQGGGNAFGVVWVQ